MKLYEDKILTEHVWWHKVALAVVAVLILLTIFGCASLGLTSPTSAQGTIAYAYTGVESSYAELAQLATTGAISKSVATKAYNAIGVVKATLDQASSAATSSAPVAVTVITQATTTLANIAAYLACNQQTPGSTSCQL